MTIPTKNVTKNTKENEYICELFKFVFLRTNTNKINRENNVRKFLSNKENVKTKFLWFRISLCLFKFCLYMSLKFSLEGPHVKNKTNMASNKILSVVNIFCLLKK